MGHAFQWEAGSGRVEIKTRVEEGGGGGVCTPSRRETRTLKTFFLR